MSDPVVSSTALADELAGSHAPLVLDVSHLLHAPRVDGDHRSESGRARFEAAHIPGSRHLDISTDLSDPTAPTHYRHPEPDALANRLAELGLGAEDRIVVTDSTGSLFAARAWYLLDWIGLDVRFHDGGVPDWVAAGLPVESGPAAPRPRVASWQGRAARDAWIELDELVDRRADDPRPLICGLAGSLFDGSATTRYARRGHIPGSVAVPARDHFAADGTLRPAPVLLDSYLSAGIELGPDRPEILLYCGGGISAAANALALARLGVRDVRIYDNSLEEWAANPNLPLATTAGE